MTDRRADIRALLGRALGADAVDEEVDLLIFEHVVEGRLHPSVVAVSLAGVLRSAVEEADEADWQAVADGLIAEAREVEAQTRGTVG
jgi:hypothetical protein